MARDARVSEVNHVIAFSFVKVAHLDSDICTNCTSLRTVITTQINSARMAMIRMYLDWAIHLSIPVKVTSSRTLQTQLVLMKYTVPMCRRVPYTNSSMPEINVQLPFCNEQAEQEQVQKYGKVGDSEHSVRTCLCPVESGLGLRRGVSTLDPN